MEITLKHVPVNSTITIITGGGNCITPPIQVRAQTQPKNYKSKFAGSKIVAFTLDGRTHSNVVSQNELKRMLLNTVQDKTFIPSWLRKNTSSDDTYNFVIKNKSIFKKFRIVLKMADGTIHTLEN